MDNKQERTFFFIFANGTSKPSFDVCDAENLALAIDKIRAEDQKKFDNPFYRINNLFLVFEYKPKKLSIFELHAKILKIVAEQLGLKVNGAEDIG